MTFPAPLPFDLAGIQLDPRRGLARQLYQALRERILDGRLARRARLPASRDLAALLGISRAQCTAMSRGKKALVPRTQELGERCNRVSKCTTCIKPCTPASVRPAHKVLTGWVAKR